MKLGCVYKITNPVEAVYVGSTKSFKKRISHYRRLACEAQPRLYESLIKYGYENHKIEIIEWVPFSELKKREREIGIFYNALDYKMGLNCFLPGYGNLKELRSEEWKKGHRKRSDMQIGRQLTGVTKEKMSKNSSRHTPSDETKSKAKEKLVRPIIQFDKSGNIINEFESATVASIVTGVGRSSIKENLNGRNKTGGGFIWKFKDGIIKGKNHKKVIQMDINGTIMKIHESVSEAARSINVDWSAIRYVATGKGVTAGGYKWKYFNEERRLICPLVDC
jgi:group I intron endonuclease